MNRGAIVARHGFMIIFQSVISTLITCLVRDTFVTECELFDLLIDGKTKESSHSSTSARAQRRLSFIIFFMRNLEIIQKFYFYYSQGCGLVVNTWLLNL